MDASQILQDLDIELIRNQSPNLAVFDSLALSVRYNFTWKEYQLGGALFALNQQVMPEVIKTMLHETTTLVSNAVNSLRLLLPPREVVPVQSSRCPVETIEGEKHNQAFAAVYNCTLSA
jgi:hypothetical protein